MLRCRGDDGSHGCEDVGTVFGWEPAGDFHFDLHHPDILLGQINGERNAKVCDEAREVDSQVARADQQIPADATGRPSPRAFLSFQRGLCLMQSQALFDDGVVDDVGRSGDPLGQAWSDTARPRDPPPRVRRAPGRIFSLPAALSRFRSSP